MATVSVSENTVLVTVVKDGSAAVTIEVAERRGENHTAPGSKTCSPRIYGVSWDGSSTTKWTRTDEAAGFTDPVPYIAGKTTAQCSSPFDNLQPWSGMVKSNRDGGVMVAIPKLWYKLTKNGNGLKIQIATKAMTGFSVHMNRGNSKGERAVGYIGATIAGATSRATAGRYRRWVPTTPISSPASTPWEAHLVG